jgi:hypothetical protein
MLQIDMYIVQSSLQGKFLSFHVLHFICDLESVVHAKARKYKAQEIHNSTKKVTIVIKSVLPIFA